MCKYSTAYCIYKYILFLVVEYCILVCFLWDCNHTLLWGSFLPAGKKRFILIKQMEVD